MNLAELTRPLFTYLVLFRAKARSASPPKPEEVRRELGDLFQHMEEETRRIPQLGRPYQEVKYILTAFADEMILASGWSQAPAWERSLLEVEFFGTNIAGDRFFELSGRLEGASREVVAIFYFCLALGFKGRYAADDHRLKEIRDDLYQKLGPAGTDAKGRLFPLAYATAHVGTRKPRRLMSWKLGLGLVAAVILTILLVDRLVIWPAFTSDVWETALAARDRLSQVTAGLAQLAPEPTAPPSSRPALSSPSANTAVPGAPTSSATAAAPKAEAKPETAREKAEQEREKKEEGEDGAWLVRSGNYPSPDQARELVGKLTSAGFTAWVSERPRAQGQPWYDVVLGPFKDFDAAYLARGHVQKRFGVESHVVRSTGDLPVSTAEKGDMPLESAPQPWPASDKAPQAGEVPKEESGGKPYLIENVPARRPGKEAYAPTPAPPTPTPAPTPAPPGKEQAREGWLVQVAAYAGPKDAGRLVNSLRSKEYPAPPVVERLQEGHPPLYVVYAGPFPSRRYAQEVSRLIAKAFRVKPFVVNIKERPEVKF